MNWVDSVFEEHEKKAIQKERESEERKQELREESERHISAVDTHFLQSVIPQLEELSAALNQREYVSKIEVSKKYSQILEKPYTGEASLFLSMPGTYVDQYDANDKDNCTNITFEFNEFRNQVDIKQYLTQSTGFRLKESYSNFDQTDSNMNESRLKEFLRSILELTS